MLDTGVWETNSTYLCEAQILVFDLNNDQLLQQIKIPNNVAQNSNGTGLLTDPIVQTEGQFCESTTVRFFNF